MGLVASTGQDNDELVDNLIEGELIRSPHIERVFRLVDRGRFFPSVEREAAYSDMAWKSEEGSPGKLHLSAPCIYANVLEHLDLRQGHSFLNVGSGTGYLSTMAGFLIGSSGRNHGIEIHSNVVEYSRERVTETLNGVEVNVVDWAIPEMVEGNGLILDVQLNGCYDRVYCGAAVPESHRRCFFQLLRVNGICVMPFQDQLQLVRRVDMDHFETENISAVSFASFIPPSIADVKAGTTYLTARVSVSSLQERCRCVIRQIIRQAVLNDKPLTMRTLCQPVGSPRSPKNGDQMKKQTEDEEAHSSCARMITRHSHNQAQNHDQALQRQIVAIFAHPAGLMIMEQNPTADVPDPSPAVDQEEQMELAEENEHGNNSPHGNSSPHGSNEANDETRGQIANPDGVDDDEEDDGQMAPVDSSGGEESDVSSPSSSSSSSPNDDPPGASASASGEDRMAKRRRFREVASAALFASMAARVNAEAAAEHVAAEARMGRGDGASSSSSGQPTVTSANFRTRFINRYRKRRLQHRRDGEQEQERGEMESDDDEAKALERERRQTREQARLSAQRDQQEHLAELSREFLRRLDALPLAAQVKSFLTFGQL